MTAILQIRHLIKRYQMGERTLQVLNGIDMEVRAGEMLMIVGRSGAGKSTLLHLMGLLDTPTAGDILVDGQDVARRSASRQARVRNQTFGYVFQFYHLLHELTALENVYLPKMIEERPFAWFFRKEEHRSRAEELLAKVGLAQRMTHRPSQLSGGERQRVAIARALMNQPKIVLCDEPTGNLDEHTSAQILELLCRLNESDGQTFVIVTHDQEMAREKGHRIVEMLDGRVMGEWAKDRAGSWLEVHAGGTR